MFENKFFQKSTIILSIQSDIIAHSRTNIMYVKTFYSGLEGRFKRNVEDYLEGVWLWRISGGGQSHNWECDWPF